MTKTADGKMLRVMRMFMAVADDLRRQSAWLAPRHYQVEVRTDPPAHCIEVRVSVRIEISQNSCGPLLALLGVPGMNVFRLRSVAVDGQPAAYEYRTPRLSVQLPGPVRAGAQLELSLAYDGRISAPKCYTGPRCTELCAENLWLPMLAFPGAMFGVQAQVTAPATEETVFCGDPVDSRVCGAERLTTWRTSYPVMSITMVSGPFSAYERQAGALKVQVLSQHGYGAAASELADMTAAVVDTGNDWFGELPLHQITVAQLHRRQYGDYAHMPLVVFPRDHLPRQPATEYMDALLEAVGHELGHFWWGNTVTSDFLAEGWLSEGFADFTKHLAVERIRGQEALTSLLCRMNAVLDAAGDVPPLAEIPFDHPHQTQVVRRKGGLFLLALRQRLGDPTSKKVLRALYSRYAGSRVNTQQFCELAQEVSGDPGLDRFLREHLYGVPRYAVRSDGRVVVTEMVV